MKSKYSIAHWKLAACLLITLALIPTYYQLLPNISKYNTECTSCISKIPTLKIGHVKESNHYHANHFYLNRTNKQHTPYESFEHVLAQIQDIHTAYTAGSARYKGLLKNPEQRICSKEESKRVEDLLCMKPLKFLPEFKNPCWYTPNHRLVCLPYFQLIGMSKCGTSDLFQRICTHPDVLPNSGYGQKEIHWWSQDRYGIYFHGMKAMKPVRFEKYLEFFATATAVIRKNVDGKGKHNMVTDLCVASQGKIRPSDFFGQVHNQYRLCCGRHISLSVDVLFEGDGSPMDFWDMTAWPYIYQNSGLTEPEVLTPHLLRHVNPDVKIIIIFRDPVDRLYSNYWFKRYPHTQNKSAEAFHATVLKAIDILHRCIRINNLRWCLYNRNMTIEFQFQTRLHLGFYSIYLKEWLEVFPRGRFLFVQTEEYSENIKTQMERIFKFLELRDLTESEMDQVVNQTRVNVTKQKRDFRPMLAETRLVLHMLYDPFTIELAEILNDKKFAWNVKIPYIGGFRKKK